MNDPARKTLVEEAVQSLVIVAASMGVPEASARRDIAREIGDSLERGIDIQVALLAAANKMPDYIKVFHDRYSPNP